MGISGSAEASLRAKALTNAFKLRMLGRLMAAEQTAEIQTLGDWWRSWEGGALPPPTPTEHHAIPGMPPPGAVEELTTLTGQVFRERFLPVMIAHHQGAVQMCERAWRDATDARLRLFASQVQHAQERQLQRLRSMSDRRA